MDELPETPGGGMTLEHVTAPPINLDGLVGLIPVELGEKLRELARTVHGTRSIVEIGSFKGMSTCYLAAGAIEGNGPTVYAVDPWDLEGNVYGKHGYTAPEVRAEFARQTKQAGVEGQIVPVRLFSIEAARHFRGSKVGLLYIDGDHDYSSVRDDFWAWSQHLAPSALVCFDDYGTRRNPGVARAVDELVKQGELREFQLVAGQLAVTRCTRG